MQTWIVDGDTITADQLDMKDNILIFFTDSQVISMRQGWSKIDVQEDTPDYAPSVPEQHPSKPWDRFLVERITPSGPNRWKVWGGRYKKYGLNCYIEVIQTLGVPMETLSVNWHPAYKLYAFGVIPDGKELANKVVEFERG